MATRRSRRCPSSSPNSRYLRRLERCREDLRHDGLAGGLDDRTARRHQGRDQPAVAPELQRRQRLAAGGTRGRLGRPIGSCDDARGVRPPAHHDRVDAERHPGCHLRRTRGRVLCLPVGEGDPRSRAAGQASFDVRSSSPNSCSTRPRWPWSPVKPSARPGYFRLSYALGDDDLVEGVNRLGKLLSEAR